MTLAEKKTIAYQTLVRPQLEYASSVWDPYTQNNKDRLEMVQRRVARYVLNRYNNTSSLTNMLHHQKWESLEHRIKSQRVTNMYKINNGELILDDSNQRFIPSEVKLRTYHDRAFEIPFSRANYHKYSFVPRTVRDWNTLPTLSLFKRTLDDIRVKSS